MLTSLRAYKDATNFLEFVVGQSTSYEVKNITGLGPTPAGVTHIPMVDLMGEHAYQHSNQAARYISITVALHAGVKSIQDLRKELYEFFPSHSKTTLRFYDSVREVVFVDGWVEEVKPNVFSSDPEMIITVACPDAYFSGFTRTTRANIVSSGTYPLGNAGNTEVGLAFTVNFASTSGGVVKIYEASSPAAYFRLVQASTVLSRAVSTEPGFKKVSNGTAKFLNEVDPLSTWITLEPGTNMITVELTGVTSLSAISWLPKWTSL